MKLQLLSVLKVFFHMPITSDSNDAGLVSAFQSGICCLGILFRFDMR